MHSWPRQQWKWAINFNLRPPCPSCPGVLVKKERPTHPVTYNNCFIHWAVCHDCQKPLSDYTTARQVLRSSSASCSETLKSFCSCTNPMPSGRSCADIPQGTGSFSLRLRSTDRSAFRKAKRKCSSGQQTTTDKFIHPEANFESSVAHFLLLELYRSQTGL
jgi:hypothetical protein